MTDDIRLPFSPRWERSSPNQVLTHAARAAAKQLNKPPFQPPLVAVRGAREREGLWLEHGQKRKLREKLGEKRKLRAARGSGITATTLKNTSDPILKIRTL